MLALSVPLISNLLESQNLFACSQFYPPFVQVGERRLIWWYWGNQSDFDWLQVYMAWECGLCRQQAAQAANLFLRLHFCIVLFLRNSSRRCYSYSTPSLCLFEVASCSSWGKLISPCLIGLMANNMLHGSVVISCSMGLTNVTNCWESRWFLIPMQWLLFNGWRFVEYSTNFGFGSLKIQDA